MDNSQGQAFHDEFHARDRDRVSKGLIPCGIGCGHNLRPQIRKSLKTFTFHRSQTPNEQAMPNRVDGIERTTGGPFLERTAEIAVLSGVAAIQSGHIHH